jgi:GWxTD domain-containing protein
MEKSKALILVFSLFALIVEVNGLPAREMELDIVRYFPSEKAMLVDAVIEIPMQAMKYEKSETDKYRYSLHFVVDLYEDNKKLFHDEWDRSAEIESQLISSEKAYIVEPILHVPLDIGGYELRVSVRDGVSGDVQEFTRKITDPGESRVLSDIVLANSIIPDTTVAGEELDIFRKGNLRINFNCGGNYYSGTSLIYFYYQIRNEKVESQTFQIGMDILDASGEVVKNLPARNLLVNPGVQADAGAFSCSGLPVGGYFLRLSTQSPEGEEQDTSVMVTKSFTVKVREEIRAEKREKHVVRNEYAGFSESQIDSVFSMMRYILSNSQKNDYKQLNIEGKRAYLHHVWKALDPIPATEENEYRDQLTELINHALEEYSTVWKAKQGEESGWAVDDRGVIHIKYGEPDERIVRPFDFGSDPYEIWKYYSSGYAYLFLEQNRTQGYELIFTNNRDESYIPTWRGFFSNLTLEYIYRELGSAVNP